MELMGVDDGVYALDESPAHDEWWQSSTGVKI